jgi:hypothetical protein
VPVRYRTQRRRLDHDARELRRNHTVIPRILIRLPEGFSHFVISMTAPVASGWSGCRAGLPPAGKRRLFTAHTRFCRSAWRKADLQSTVMNLHPARVPCLGHAADAEENQTCSYSTTVVSSGVRSDVSQTDRTDHAARESGVALKESFVEAPPTHGMNQAVMKGLASRPPRAVRVISIAGPTLSAGRQGKIMRPPGRNACNHDCGGTRTPAFT